MPTLYKPKPHTQNAAILDVLSDGRWHTNQNIHQTIYCVLHSRISELRAHGLTIEHRTNPHAKRGSLAHSYRWVDAPAIENVEDSQLTLASDRTPDERFRLYTVCNGQRTLVATCPDAECVGVAICTLAAEGTFNEPGCSIGLLDTHGVPAEEKPGTWVINPWNSRVV
jgi:hypothetical protein